MWDGVHSFEFQKDCPDHSAVLDGIFPDPVIHVGGGGFSNSSLSRNAKPRVAPSGNQYLFISIVEVEKLVNPMGPRPTLWVQSAGECLERPSWFSDN